MLRLVGITIPDDVDLFNGLRMIKGLDTNNSRAKIEKILTKAGLYNRQLQPNGKIEKVYPKVGDLSWKQKARLIDLLEMPRAVIRNVRISPRKLRLVADHIRGKSVDEALGILQFMPKRGASILLKLLKSAIANAGANHDLKADNLYIAKITVDGGPIMKRFMTRARGRACRINKRTSHAKIVLREKFSMAKLLASESTKAVSKASRQNVTSSVSQTETPLANNTTNPQGGNE